MEKKDRQTKKATMRQHYLQKPSLSLGTTTRLWWLDQEEGMLTKSPVRTLRFSSFVTKSWKAVVVLVVYKTQDMPKYCFLWGNRDQIAQGSPSWSQNEGLPLHKAGTSPSTLVLEAYSSTAAVPPQALIHSGASPLLLELQHSGSSVGRTGAKGPSSGMIPAPVCALPGR